MCSILTSLWIMPLVRTCEQGCGVGGGGRGEAVLAVKGGLGKMEDGPAGRVGCQVLTFVMLLHISTVTVKPVWKLRTLP